jgi:hypothetical protein
MRLRLNKRGEENTSLKKIIVIILVLLVIVVIFIFIFRSDILEWMRNLPGYSVSKEDRSILLDEIPKGIEGASKFGCQNPIAKIGTETGIATKIYFNGKDSGLVLYPTKKGFADWNSIRVYNSWWLSTIKFVTFIKFFVDEDMAKVRYLKNKDGSTDFRAKIIEVTKKSGNKEIDAYLNQLNGKFIIATDNMVICDVK